MKKIKSLLLLLTSLVLCSAGTSVAAVGLSAISNLNTDLGVAYADEQEDTYATEGEDTEDCD